MLLLGDCDVERRCFLEEVQVWFGSEIVGAELPELVGLILMFFPILFIKW